MSFMTNVATNELVLADGGSGGQGGPDIFLIVMIVVFGLLIFMMFRKNKKAQQQQQEKRSSLTPGQEIMTTAGIFGTVVDVNHDDNKVTIEVSPGTNMTVHVQAVGQIIESDQAEAAQTSEVETETAGEEYKDSAEDDTRHESDTKPSLNPDDPRGDADQK